MLTKWLVLLMMVFGFSVGEASNRYLQDGHLWPFGMPTALAWEELPGRWQVESGQHLYQFDMWVGIANGQKILNVREVKQNPSVYFGWGGETQGQINVLMKNDRKAYWIHITRALASKANPRPIWVIEVNTSKGVEQIAPSQMIRISDVIPIQQ